jgi:hypothetical protein
MTPLSNPKAYSTGIARFVNHLIQRNKPENQNTGLAALRPSVSSALNALVELFPEPPIETPTEDDEAQPVHENQPVQDEAQPVQEAPPIGDMENAASQDMENPGIQEMDNTGSQDMDIDVVIAEDEDEAVRLEQEKKLKDDRYLAMIKLLDVALLERVRAGSGKLPLCEEFVIARALKADGTFMSPQVITPSISPLMYAQRAVTLQKLVNASREQQQNDGSDDNTDAQDINDDEDAMEKRYRKIASLVAYGTNGTTSYQCLKMIKGAADIEIDKTLRLKQRGRQITQTENPNNPVLSIKDKAPLSANQFKTGVDSMMADLDEMLKDVIFGFNDKVVGIEKFQDPTLFQDIFENNSPGYGISTDRRNTLFIRNESALLRYIENSAKIRKQFYTTSRDNKKEFNLKHIQSWIAQVDKIWELFMMLIVLLCGGSPRMTELELFSISNSSQQARSLRIMKNRIAFHLKSIKSQETFWTDGVTRFVHPEIAKRLLFAIGVIRPCYM